MLKIMIFSKYSFAWNSSLFYVFWIIRCVKISVDKFVNTWCNSVIKESKFFERMFFSMYDEIKEIVKNLRRKAKIAYFFENKNIFLA